MDGSHPSEWEYQGMDINPSLNPTTYTVTLELDPCTGQDEVRYEKKDEDTPVLPDFYSTTGTHNEWAEDRMMEGDVPCLYYQELEIPDNGVLEFRILSEGDPKKVIGPSVPRCDRKSAPILGPEEDLTNSWQVTGEPGSAVRIEFLAPPRGPRSITWIRQR